MKQFALILSVVLVGGCAGSQEFVNVRSLEFRDAIPIDASIRLQVAVGELLIRGIDGPEISAQAELSCQTGDEGCLRRADKVRFASDADTSAMLVALEPTSMMKWNDLQATIEIEVPRDRALFVDMGAGELDIVSMRNCVELDMYAGDATIHVATSAVGSVALDVGTGDTSLVVDGRTISGRRALLIGAELEWNQGQGWCRVYGDLQFGDLTVILDDREDPEAGGI